MDTATHSQTTHSHAAHGHDPSQYLTFVIAGDEYAIRILQVREIIQCDAITKVPRTPPWIRGVFNLRGGVVPVVDLAVKFGLAETPLTDTTCIVVTEVNLEGEQAVMGVLADSVSQVVDLREDEIEPPPRFGTSVQVDYLLGMGKVDGKLALILDIDRVLSTDELLAASAVAESAEVEAAAS